MNQDGIGKGKIGLTTFVTSPVPHNKCGSDGLPITPNSIKVLGRAQSLKALKHKNLCNYLDFCRGKHDRMFCISEYHDDNVLQLIPKQRSAILNDWYRVVTRTVYEILEGLAFLDKHSIVHHNLHPSNILFDHQGTVRLYNYGLYFMTDCGQEVSFPIGSQSYLSPEEHLFLGGHHEKMLHFPSSKLDVWSLGIICLELCLGQQVFQNHNITENCESVLSLLKCSSSEEVVQNLIIYSGGENCARSYQTVPDPIKMMIQSCLAVDPSNRPTPKQLLDLDLFSELCAQNAVEYGERSTLFTSGCDCSGLKMPSAKDYAAARNIEPLLEREYPEIWHLWKLAGGDVFTEVRRSDTVHSVPPILDLPLSMSLFGEVISLESSVAHLYDSNTIVLSLDALKTRLKDVVPESYYPLVEDLENGKTNEAPVNQLKDTTSSLPLVIKENDIEYQLHRIVLYKRLLLGYPHLRDKIWKEARIDIPPHLRGLVWAALLDVSGDVRANYRDIDKETPLRSDRQIAVDIPRCHQYDPLLSSPTAHKKFKRVLKAWLKSHPYLSYWQGLDSLCAAFLHLNFNTEHLAWASMSNFIDKYLHNFFLKDNSPIIQEYLAVFRHLIAFHEPELSNHLDSIGFIPELYSIPWFLTMFTHVFPLHKIVHLWDTLLLGNSSFPLCVGVAILKQLKSQLLSFDFNECILMFSDLPEIDIDAVVQSSINLFCATPKSAAYRKHAKRKDPNARKNVSYYSEDYNSATHDELSMSEVPLEDLKSEVSPRISADDMIELCELRGPSQSKTPAKRTSKNSKPKICILDVRSADEFHRAAIPGSHNVPYQSIKSEEGGLAQSSISQTLDQLKPRLIIVIGNKQSRDAAKFAALLVSDGYRGVLVLHQGIDVLRTTGLLTIQ